MAKPCLFVSLFNLYYVDVLDGFSIIQLPVFTYAVLKISYCFYISFMKVLLSYSSTDCNLKGDLGNTPLMLACSLNNCEALSMLVCTRLHVVPRTYTLLQMITVNSSCSFLLLQLCFWQKTMSLCFAFSSIHISIKVKAWSEALPTEQAWPFRHARCCLRRCEESHGSHSQGWYDERKMLSSKTQSADSNENVFYKAKQHIKLVDYPPSR